MLKRKLLMEENESKLRRNFAIATYVLIITWVIYSQHRPSVKTPQLVQKTVVAY